MCSRNSLPTFSDDLGIPRDINVAFVPGGNASMADMTKCCAPNKVHVASGNKCILWCEAPRGFYDEKDDADDIAGEISSTLAHCVGALLNSTTVDIFGGHAANSGATNVKGPTVMGVAVFAITMSFLVGVGL